MESWEILEEAIPRKASNRVASLLGVSADYVRRWRREPASDDAPTSSGQRSILDRICDLIDAVFLVNPRGVGLVVNYINSHYQNLMEIHAQPMDSAEARSTAAADLLVEAVQAVNSLNVTGCTQETYNELIQLRDAADEMAKRVEKSLGGNHESEND